jgi:hypothetical protein
MKTLSGRTLAIGLVCGAIGVGAVIGPRVLERPPPEEGPLGALAVQVDSTPDGFDLTVRNRGRVPQSVAQVAVNAGTWPTDLGGPAILDPGEEAHVRLYYHWIPGELYQLKVVGSRGAVATGEVTPS